MRRIAPTLALLLALAGIIACAGGVRDADRAEMEALPPAQGGPIVERLLPDLEAHPGLTGVRLVDSNVDAFAVRVAGRT
jgi:hypothetical protein